VIGQMTRFAFDWLQVKSKLRNMLSVLVVVVFFMYSDCLALCSLACVVLWCALVLWLSSVLLCVFSCLVLSCGFLAVVFASYLVVDANFTPVSCVCKCLLLRRNRTDDSLPGVSSASGHS
jgi:hypothetical protein